MKRSTTTSAPTTERNLEILRGRDGRDGRDGLTGPKGVIGPPGQNGDTGVPGPKGDGAGGVVYVRWSHDSCPDGGAQLVYAGRAGGSDRTHQGGGGNPVSTIGPKFLQDSQWITKLGIHLWSRISRHKWTSSKFS